MSRSEGVARMSASTLSRRARRATLALLGAGTLGLAAAVLPGPTEAAPRETQSQNATRRWGQPRFAYRAEGKRVAEVLQDFAASQGLPAVIAEGVDGLVNANFDTTPEVFLNAMSKAYGLLWYHDGTALYFYPAKAVQSRLFRLKGFSQEQVQELLDSLQVGDRRYPLRFNEAQQTLLAYGPPRHVELVRAALETLDTGAQEGNRMVARVFPLRFASASDRVLGDATIPGVASTLRSLFGAPPTPEADPRAAAKDPRAMAGKVKAMRSMYGSDRLVPELEHKTPDPAAADPSGKPPLGSSTRGLRSPVDFEEDQPSFEADEGTNAVVIYGRAHRMDEYADVIRSLDVRPNLVELEAMIVDVSHDSVESLGIDWSVRGSKGSFSVDAPGGGMPDASRGAGLSQGVFNIQTLLTDAGRELLMRIHALQAQGKARVVAKPKVLGVANRPAVMKEKRIAAVRVSGNLEANLFQVEAGTLLQVTPQITTQSGAPQIKLSLYIEDGNFEARQVDDIPVVKRTEIRTEAHVADGESLLIGGITIEADTTDTSGVPVISKIPVIGGLFRWQGSRSTRSERLFLITPKLVRSIDQLPSAPAGPIDPLALPPAAPASAVPAAPPVVPVHANEPGASTPLPGAAASGPAPR
ncbi:type III secretion system outer membrane ring subunit SctC [Aquabacterium sp. A7-Y]|uniref:type III secretion system outer membrane ring subunit SctC n=1 Tax=Aquabacterium sp. A7-Y TaxID=1349605 RepID=UPI00223C9DF8|nr:type III secretion system outer membrane ring subunit SctC [Aquabacterium sp. A7-Y]MCW7540275.1 type III secretion system outer membrane ring subunit SctC [Aquabacterium sp. A7-Y]